MQKTRVCKVCGLVKEISEFPKGRYRCKVCQATYLKNWAKKDKEKSKPAKAPLKLSTEKLSIREKRYFQIAMEGIDLKIDLKIVVEANGKKTCSSEYIGRKLASFIFEALPGDIWSELAKEILMFENEL